MDQESDGMDLIRFIRARLEELHWTQAKLAEASGLSTGAVSNLLSRRAVPETRTVERIADALGVSRQGLLGYLAREGREETVVPEIHAGALHVARRLNALPDEIRQRALVTVEAVIDGIESLAELMEVAEVIGEHGVLAPLEEVERQLRMLKRSDPELYAELMRETEARWRAGSVRAREGS